MSVRARKERLLHYPWRKFFEGLYERSLNADLLSRSAQVAFYFAFSIFPLLFFLVSLFGLVLDSATNLQAELDSYLRQIMPMAAYGVVRDTLSEIVESSSTGKLTIGLLITLWSASAGVDSIRNALNAVYELRETRWWWRRKLQSLTITLIFITLIALGLGLVFYGWRVFQAGLFAMGFHTASPLLLGVVQWSSILLVMLFAFELIYNLLPNFTKRRWLWITPGSIAAIVLWVLLTRGFAVYLSYFNSYSRTYGSLGAVMILLLWLYLAGVVVIVGGAINATCHRLRAEEDANAEALDAEPDSQPDTPTG